MNDFQLQLIKDLESKFNAKTPVSTAFSISDILKKIDDSKSMSLDIESYNKTLIAAMNNELKEGLKDISEQLLKHGIYCDVQQYDNSYHDYMRVRMNATFCRNEKNRGNVRNCTFAIEPRLEYTSVWLPNGDYVQKIISHSWEVFTTYNHACVKFKTLTELISSEYFEKKIINLLKP